MTLAAAVSVVQALPMFSGGLRDGACIIMGSVGATGWETLPPRRSVRAAKAFAARRSAQPNEYQVPRPFPWRAKWFE